MAETVADLMPLVHIAGHAVSRLLIGGNPFSSNSHVSPATDADMRRYHTVSRVLADLRRAERWGVSALQSRGDNHMIRLMLDHWSAGGRLQWWAQTASERADIFGNIRQIANAGATAIYHHGTRTDSLWHRGRIDEVVPYLKAIRDTGCLVGLGTHIPEVLDYADEHQWDVDFYMASLYNLSRAPRESAVVSPGQAAEERFLDSDRPVMLRAIRRTPKPVLVFKILGASRRAAYAASLEQAMVEALDGIKPSDAMVVGVFTKYGDQIAQDCRIVMDWERRRASRTP